jgi:hypothetical protein
VAATAEGIEGTAIGDWLGGMSIAVWRDRFDATAGDVVDLLELTRSGRAGVVRDLLESGEARIEEPTTQAEVAVEIRSLALPDCLGRSACFALRRTNRWTLSHLRTTPTCRRC